MKDGSTADTLPRDHYIHCIIEKMLLLWSCFGSVDVHSLALSVYVLSWSIACISLGSEHESFFVRTLVCERSLQTSHISDSVDIRKRASFSLPQLLAALSSPLYDISFVMFSFWSTWNKSATKNGDHQAREVYWDTSVTAFEEVRHSRWCYSSSLILSCWVSFLPARISIKLKHTRRASCDSLIRIFDQLKRRESAVCVLRQDRGPVCF